MGWGGMGVVLALPGSETRFPYNPPRLLITFLFRCFCNSTKVCRLEYGGMGRVYVVGDIVLHAA